MIDVFNTDYYNDVKKTKLIYHIKVDDVRSHLRDYDNDVPTDIIERLIKVAYRMAENYIGYDIAYTLNELKVYDFFGDFINIKSASISKVSGISYLDNENNYVEITDYQVLTKYNRFVISFQHSWDNNYTIETDELLIKYYTGYELDLELPEDIKNAIIVKVADLIDIETNSYTTSSYKKINTFENMLDFYKIIKLW